MVSSNRGYPDPDKSPDDITPNDIIVTADTDTEDEENPYNDYEPLPTSEVADSDESDSSSDCEEGAVGNVESLPPIKRMEDVLVQEVWASPTPKATDIVMDSTTVDQVKQAMVNFSLPQNCIPEWANHVPEEHWKQQLINKLQHMQNK